ncbi:hypothetical protein COV17_01295 [Candidatus Woesearchaeota archaeon CG10_big_fil_rev_8_21_14_0_10_36_11]|nr:MAG: hypothetical protein COV17_01295 [Candidatus Woesearchaeota archaeon CG10_big_fil_rev_8_21_14_0_10_36_11]
MYKLKLLPEDFIVREISTIAINKNGRYAYVKITKRDRNTIDVLKELAKQLKIKENTIGFAGSKDKHAITEQLFSILNVRKERLKDVVINNVTIECVGWGNVPISLGDLKRNEFEIVVRNIDIVPSEKISLVENYFDEQRFSKNNAMIGKHLIKKEFSDAVKLIDHKEVMEHVPKTDFIGALKELPLRMLRMYINAYQSYVWNETVRTFLEKKCVVTRKVPYSLGEFVFVEDNEKLVETEVPLVGFGSDDLETEDVRSLICIIMQKEEITYNDFIIKQVPELTLEGELRNVFVKVENLVFGIMEKDELNPGKNKVTVSFSLPKGSYATMVIRKLFYQ